MNTALKYDITAELLSALQRERYDLGVGEHLQIQTLLQKLPDTINAEDLKHALIPLIAKTKVEQERLYGLFDEIVKNIADKNVDGVNISNLVGFENLRGLETKTFWQTFVAIIKQYRWIIIAFLAVLLAVFCFFAWKYTHPELRKDRTDNIRIGRSTAPQTEVPKPQPPKQESPFVENKPYPFPNHLEDYSYKPPSKAQEWLQNNWKWARILLAFALCGLLFALWRYRALKNRKLVAEQNQNEKPPYFWNIELTDIDKNIFDANTIEHISTLLRHRSEADKFRMDIPKTIDATVTKGGSPTFIYKTETSPTDYLLLIDRQSVRNHRARLFDALYEAFKAQEVEVARFFFDSDVRVCFNEMYPNGISISEIQLKYYNSRLVIIGTGVQLLSPLSGKLAKWTEIFEQWRIRALLTPKPLKLWGYDEKQLATLFITLPATLDSLSFWIDELDAGADSRFDTWRTKVNDAPNAPIEPDAADPIPILQMYFEKDVIEWIAACAIYPSLHFDLTLWFGQHLSNKDKKLCTYQNLSQIFRLSWFVSGEMPKASRVALLDWFEKTDGTTLTNLRAALAFELGKNPPPKDSAVFEQFRMNMALNEWLSTSDKEKKKNLEHDIADQLANGSELDVTVIKYLQKPRTRLDFFVPNQWKKFVHPCGYAALGWLKEYKDLRWLLPILLVGLVGLFWNYKFDANACKNESVANVNYATLDPKIGKGYFGVFADDGKSILTKSSFKDVKSWNDQRVRLCKSDTLADIVRTEYNVHDAIVRDNYSIASGLLLGENTPSNYDVKNIKASLYFDTFYLKGNLKAIQVLKERNSNIAVDYYYVAKEFYEKKMLDSACYYLNIAYKLDSTNTDINKAQQMVCKNTYKPIVAVPTELQKIFDNKKPPLEGLDISHFNTDGGGVIDFDFIEKNYAFVYVKTTEGSAVKDTRYLENFKSLSYRHILRGAYHVFKMMDLNVQGQIDNFLNAGIDYKKNEILPAALDIELTSAETKNNSQITQNKDAIIARMHTWLDEVERRTGKTPIIHTSQLVWDNVLKSPTGFERYELWVPSYSNTAKQPNMPLNWKNYYFWQYTNNGNVNGKTGFDINRTNLTYQDLINLTYARRDAINHVSQNATRTDALNASQTNAPSNAARTNAPLNASQINAPSNAAQTNAPNLPQKTGDANKQSLPNPINSLPQRNINSENNTIDNTSLDNELNQLNELMRGADPKTANCYDASFKAGKAYYDKGNYELASAQWKIALDCKTLPDGIRKVLNNLINKLNAKIQNKTINLEMVFVQGGTFMMGQPDPDIGGKGLSNDEQPPHKVTLSDFYIGKTEVTQAQWRAVMGSDPPELNFVGCNNCPVDDVSWDDIQEFLKTLNAESKNKYRLPTEAEWEYAARGVAKSKNYTYSGSNNVDEVAWLSTNSGSKTHAVGTLVPNELGIYDMSGNVWEWCSDWYGEEYYKNSPTQNPQGAVIGSNRVLRGGGWGSSPRFCRAAHRYSFTPADRNDSVGFRVASPLQ